MLTLLQANFWLYLPAALSDTPPDPSTPGVFTLKSHNFARLKTFFYHGLWYCIQILALHTTPTFPDTMTKKGDGLRVSQLDSPERVEQLEKIDILRELGVGNEINLPQVQYYTAEHSLPSYDILKFTLLAGGCRRSVFWEEFTPRGSQRSSISCCQRLMHSLCNTNRLPKIARHRGNHTCIDHTIDGQ